MPPELPQTEFFNTEALFLAEREVLGSSGADFVRDLERFALRAEMAEKSQAGIVVLEALVIFGRAGRTLDEDRWNLLANEAAAHVRKGEEEAAARLLTPHDAQLSVETLAPTVELARMVRVEGATDSQSTGRSRCAAIIAALFRALASHFAGICIEDCPADAGAVDASPEDIDAPESVSETDT
ncbi:hypothetical protein EDF56_105104 [Novosphingobium sp. PhB165]|uniref:hypothetical protein n=1 Tax=Novosphingobium sp. PhB165 TaxID=2485105 RepID=UPI0010533DFF|nr:hypothetical protein [Novosphingobium sp. PhB165]TCM17761.1 hypothetical protein EDF56_105104 [Novosphingobium sp. PhB165]